jgi:hypothetical protein
VQLRNDYFANQHRSGDANYWHHLVPWHVPVAANRDDIVNVLSGFTGVEGEPRR